MFLPLLIQYVIHFFVLLCVYDEHIMNKSDKDCFNVALLCIKGMYILMTSIWEVMLCFVCI